MNKNVLLLSATIRPPTGVPNLSRTNPDVRLRDYLAAFDFYLAQLNHGLDAIVFAENSGSDLSPLAERASAAGAGRCVEFVSFNGLDHPPTYGRGYGEFKLVDHAMAHSVILSGDRDSLTVWKGTGRYILRNLGYLIRTCPRPFDLYCNLRDYPQRWGDLYMMAWSARGYEQFIKGIYTQFRDDKLKCSSEVVFRSLADAVRPHIRVVPRFLVPPLIEGVRGYDNIKYHDKYYSMKYRTRLFASRFLPWLWI